MYTQFAQLPVHLFQGIILLAMISGNFPFVKSGGFLPCKTKEKSKNVLKFS